MTHDVFISYSSKDKTIADAVCAKLEEHKIRVWIAPRDVPPGSNFAESIIRAINTCKVFVLIWSANSNASNHILNEINQAFDQGITIIPFRIQDIQPTDEMRYYFGRTHWLDAITPPLEKHIAVLRDTILINLGREPQPAKQPVDSQETSVERIHEPVSEKEPTIEQAEAAKPPALSPRQKKQKLEKEIQPRGAAPANLTRFIPLAVGAVAVLTLVILLLSGVFKGSPPGEIAQMSPSVTSPITPTRAVKPTETSALVPTGGEEADALAEPILEMINNFPPDFADDFSQFDPNWFSPIAEAPPECINAGEATMSVTDGSMKYSITNCQVGLLQYTDMQYANYVLQLDVNFQGAPLGLEFRFWDRSSFDGELQLDYYLQHDGAWGFSVWRNGTFIEGIDGVYSLDSSKPVTITIINKSPAFLVYLDSSLQTFYNTQEKYEEPFELDFTVNSWGVTPTETLTLELDNLKIWDLDRIEEVNALAESTLVMINKFPPDFEDDFSQVDPNWAYNLDACPGPDSTPTSIAYGSNHITISPGCPHIGLTHPDFQHPPGDYVMQMDINFQQTDLAFEFAASSPNGFAVDFSMGDDAWATFKPIPDSDGMQTVGDGSIQSNASEPVTLTIIKKGTAFLFYLNSELLTVHDIQAEVAYEHEIGFAVNNWSCRDTCNPETFSLENFKIWDLDKIEESIAVSESILAAVQDLPPDFADDFSQVDPNWYSPLGEGPPECINVGDAVINITDGSMKYSITNCQVGLLQYEDMEYSNYVLQLDVNYQQESLDFDFRIWSQSPLDGNIMMDYHLHGPDGQWAFGVWEDGEVVEGVEGNSSHDFSEPVTITIINQSPAFIVYLDSTLLTLYNTQQAYVGPFLLDFTVHNWGFTPTETFTLELDNLKIWDLNKIED